MKKITITTIVLFFAFGLFAQDISLAEEVKQQYSELDTSKITTGILYDRVIPFSGIENFDGKTNIEVCTQAQWKQIYFELQNATQRDTAGQHDLDFIFGRKQQFTNGKLIPIYIANYQYNKIKENALEDELLLMSGDKIVENPDKSQSPYEQKRVFVATPYMNHTYYGDNFEFMLNGNYLYTNTGEELVEIFANFNDGMGEREIQEGEQISISYAEIGTKTISIKAITNNEDTLVTNFKFEVRAKSIPAYENIRVEYGSPTGDVRWFCPQNNSYYDTWAGGAANSPCSASLEKEILHYKGGSLFHFRSPVTPDKIDRTILLVEGFDGADVMFAEYLYGELLNKQKLADCLLANNYDIFILNYDVPTDDIYNNAELVKGVIERINQTKDNKTELVVAGGSMGGLVTRVALKKMEDQGGDTQTRLWISFDSPQLGANIPLGMQFWVKEVNSVLYTGGSSLDKINSPAAKQMLLYHHTGYPNGNVISERTDFADELESLGFPETSRNVAITCGASDGTGQGYEPETKIIDISWLFGARHIYAWAVPDGGTDFTVCKRTSVNIWGNTVTKAEYKISNTNAIDNAPGGFYPTMKYAEDMGAGLVTALEDNHAFIPSLSALAINYEDVEDGYFYNFFDAGLNAIISKTPFDMVYYPKLSNESDNQEHVWVSLETAENIINELYPENVVLGNPNSDWEQGEVQATRSVRLTQGFHASASDQFHAHIEQPINILEEEFWTPSKQKHKNAETVSSDISENKNIYIFPNPTDSKINIASNNDKIKKIEIADITGKVVAIYKVNSLLNYKIDLSSQTQGIYIIKITTENKILTSKIIKQ